MSSLADNLPTLSSATDRDETPHQPTQGTSVVQPVSDPETPRSTTGRSIHFLTRLANVFLLPFNMWAPLPDYQLERRLRSHPDERVHHDLYRILLSAQALRTQQWRVAYWTAAVSLLCTLGIALIGTATAILTFNNNRLAQKILSIIVAAFGVILSFLKGTSLPADAFMRVNKANDIVDTIDDFDISNDKFDTKRLAEIKATWRAVRDSNITEQATVWRNIEKQ